MGNLGMLFFALTPTMENPLFLCMFGEKSLDKYVESNARDMCSPALGPNMLRAM